MNWPHVHLALNHLPVFGTPFVLLLLLIALFRRSEELKRLSLWFLVVLTLVAIPIKFTGDKAWEDLMEADLDSKRVEAHEEAADQAVTVLFVAGVIAAVGLFQARRQTPVKTWAMWASAAMCAAAFLMLARTANMGGEIQHREIRADKGEPAPALEMKTVP